MTDPQTTLFSLQARSLPLPTLPTLLTLLTYLPVRYPQPIPPSLHHTIIPIYLSIYGVLTYLHTHTHTPFPSLPSPPLLPLSIHAESKHTPSTRTDQIRSDQSFSTDNAIKTVPLNPLPGWKYGNTEIRLSLSFVWLVWFGEGGKRGKRGK